MLSADSREPLLTILNLGRSVLNRDLRPFVVIAAIACVAGCSKPDGTPSDSGTNSNTAESATSGDAGKIWTISPAAFGPLRLGQPVREVAAVLGDTARPTDESCGYVAPATFPDSVSVMIVNDTAMRVDVRSSMVRTAEGAGIGDSEQRIQELYRGRVRVQPHKYTDGRYLIVTPTNAADSSFRIVFETDGAKVVLYRAGRLPAVEWVEGCS